MFVHAVVVGNNRAGAEVGFAADLGITDVGEVVGFGAVADGGVLTSTKLPMCTSLASLACGRKRAYGPIWLFSPTSQPSKWENGAILGVGTDFGVFDHAVGTDFDVCRRVQLRLR